MGVPGLFSYIRNGAGIGATSRTIPKTDVLAIDLNGIIHLCAQKVWKYTTNHTNFPKDVALHNIHVYAEVAQELSYIVRTLTPSHVIVATDGVVGRAKQVQQRSRRYRSAKERLEKNPVCPFDTNCISPGTQFMRELDKFLSIFFDGRKEGEWAHLSSFVYSSDSLPGEGEHKIMEILKQDTYADQSVTIYGMDGDLIMLGLVIQQHLYTHNPTQLPQVFLIRDLHEPRMDFVIDITKVRMFYASLFAQKADIATILYDIVAMYFLLGNDFLPNIVDIFDGGIQSLHNAYVALPDTLSLCKHHNGRVMIDVPVFKTFLKLLKREVYGHPSVDVPSVVEATSNAPISSSRTIQYWKGLDWVIRYYVDGIPSWTWFYEETYPPTLDELIGASWGKNNTCSIWWKDDTKPDPAILQLLHILPPTSRMLVPVAYRNIFDYHPQSFDVDTARSGGDPRRSHLDLVLLPPLDVEGIYRRYMDVKNATRK